MKVVMFQMAASLKHLLPRDTARDLQIPPRIPREREPTTAEAAADDCPSPARSKQKPNGASTNRGKGA
jgi:hypothetical protein